MINKFKNECNGVSDKMKKFIEMAEVYMIKKPNSDGERFECPDLEFDLNYFPSNKMGEIKIVINKDSIQQAKKLMSQTEA